MTDQEEIKKPNKAKHAMQLAALPCFMLLPALTALAAYIAVMLSEKGSRYISDSWASTAFTVLLIISLILPISALFIYKGREAVPSHTVSRIFSPITACSMLYAVYFAIVGGFGEKWDMIFLLLLILSATFYIIKPIKGHEALKTAFSFAVFALGTAIIALLYFDLAIELNSTYKLAVQFGAAGLMLKTIVDAREIMSRISLQKALLLRGISLTLTLIAPAFVLPAAIGITTLPPSYYTFSLIFLACSASNVAELVSILSALIRER